MDRLIEELRAIEEARRREEMRNNHYDYDEDEEIKIEIERYRVRPMEEILRGVMQDHTDMTYISWPVEYEIDEAPTETSKRKSKGPSALRNAIDKMKKNTEGMILTRKYRHILTEDNIHNMPFTNSI